MVWVVVGVGLAICALWALRRSRGEAEDHLRQPADPFVDRRSMERYHAALRPKRR